MSAILQNRFVNWFAASIAVLWVLGWVPSASAQDADPRISGTCTPRTQEQGPWDCKINKLIKVQCLSEKSTGYEEVWKLVRNEDEASALSKSMYLKLDGPIKFSQWLGCQDFSHVQIFSPAVEFPGMLPVGQSIHIGISHSHGQAPFPTFWLTYLFSTGGDFEIDIDNFGQIKNIKYVPNSIF